MFMHNYWFPFIAILVLMLLASCDPFGTKLKESDVLYRTAQLINVPDVPDTLHVMTWNIKFGGGRIDFFFDCFGDRVVMSQDEVIRHLTDVAEFLNATQPDVLFVQEIDVDSKRSAFVEQLEWLLNHTHLNYGVYASQWKASFIPSDGLGRMNSGVAILSRWPLSDARRIALPLIKEQNPLVRYFYLKRCLLECSMDINGRQVTLLTTHTEPYAADGTKKRQLDQIFNRLVELDDAGEAFILGGDLNALPPGTDKVKGFPDSVCPPGKFDADDYSAESDWLTPFYERFRAAVPLEAYQADNAPYFTHTVDGIGFWNRKLDFIFSNRQFVEGSDITWQDESRGGFATMPISDHCPVSVKWVLD